MCVPVVTPAPPQDSRNPGVLREHRDKIRQRRSYADVIGVPHAGEVEECRNDILNLPFTPSIPPRSEERVTLGRRVTIAIAVPRLAMKGKQQINSSITH